MHLLEVFYELYPDHSGGLGVVGYEICKRLALIPDINLNLYTKKDNTLFQPLLKERFVSFSQNAIELGILQQIAKIYPTFDMSLAYNLDVLMFNLAYFQNNFLFLKENRPIIHVHDWISIPLAYVAKKLLDLPVLITFHTLNAQYFLNGPLELCTVLELTGLSNGDAITCVSKSLKDEIIDYRHQITATFSNVSVILNGFSPNRFQRNLLNPTVQVRAKQEVLPEQNILLFLGRLIPQKGVDLLLDAFAKVLDRGIKAKLLIIGEGVNKTYYQTYANHKGFGKLVEFLGWIPDLELPNYFNQVDYFIVPSRYEPFGLVILEGQYFGLPPIAARVGGIPEILHDGIDGILFEGNNSDDLADKLIFTITHPESYGKLKQGCAKNIENFSWDVSNQKYVQVIRSLSSVRNKSLKLRNSLAYFQQSLKKIYSERSKQTISQKNPGNSLDFNQKKNLEDLLVQLFRSALGTEIPQALSEEIIKEFTSLVINTWLIE